MREHMHHATGKRRPILGQNIAKRAVIISVPSGGGQHHHPTQQPLFGAAMHQHFAFLIFQPPDRALAFGLGLFRRAARQSFLNALALGGAIFLPWAEQTIWALGRAYGCAKIHHGLRDIARSGVRRIRFKQLRGIGFDLGF